MGKGFYNVLMRIARNEVEPDGHEVKKTQYLRAKDRNIGGRLDLQEGIKKNLSGINTEQV